MAGVGPLALSAAVHEVAVILDGANFRISSFVVRRALSFESASAQFTVSVHLDSATGVDQVAELLDLGPGAVRHIGDLYSRGGHRRPGLYVSLYGPEYRPASIAAAGQQCAGGAR